MSLLLPFLLLFTVLIDPYQVNGKVLDMEPLLFIKSLLQAPAPMQVSTWQKFKDITENSTQIVTILDAIGDMVQTRAVLKVNEDYLTVLSLPKGLNYLLDGFETDVVGKRLRDIDFAGDIVVPKSLRGNTLLELLSKLPQYSQEQIGLVNEMNVQARTTFLTVSDLLGKNVKDGWRDVFLSMSLDNAVLTEDEGIEAPLNDIGMFTQSVLLDLKSVEALPPEKLPSLVRGNGYAFGWWLNCESGQSCLMGVLPRDAIISFSPALRLYIIPCIGTGFVIANTVQKTHNSRTMRDLLNFDSELFSRMLRVVEGYDREEFPPNNINNIANDKPHVPSPSSNTHSTQAPGDDYTDAFLESFFRTLKQWIVLYMEFVAQQYLVVRALLWVLFLLVAHLVTAWIYHGIWMVMCKLVKRTHDPRPKIE